MPTGLTATVDVWTSHTAATVDLWPCASTAFTTAAGTTLMGATTSAAGYATYTGITTMLAQQHATYVSQFAAPRPGRASLRQAVERQAAQRAAAQQLAQEQSAEGQQRRQQANARARELLLEHLTPEQRETFTANGWFIVTGGKTGKRYRIANAGVAGNIQELAADGIPAARLCGHAARDIPDHDQYLAQKLMLELDEEAYRRLANRSVMR